MRHDPRAIDAEHEAEQQLGVEPRRLRAAPRSRIGRRGEKLTDGLRGRGLGLRAGRRRRGRRCAAAPRPPARPLARRTRRSTTASPTRRFSRRTSGSHSGSVGECSTSGSCRASGSSPSMALSSWNREPGRPGLRRARDRIRHGVAASGRGRSRRTAPAGANRGSTWSLRASPRQLATPPRGSRSAARPAAAMALSCGQTVPR